MQTVNKIYKEKMMEKKELVEQVNKAFDHSKDRRDYLFMASSNVLEVQLFVEITKSTAILNGKIDGKNEEARKAQLNQLCSKELADLKGLEVHESQARFQYEIAQLELERVKMLLRILELDLE